MPHLDGRLEYVGVSKLRALTDTALSALKNPLVIMPHYLRQRHEPLAVIIPYQTFLEIQSVLSDRR